MFLLARNVLLHSLSRSRTHGKCPVPRLPGEPLDHDLVMNPHGRSFFQFANEVGQTMRRLQSHEKVNVVGHPTDALRHTAQTYDRSAEVLVKPMEP